MLSDASTRLLTELADKELNRVNQLIAENRAMGGRSPRFFEDLANRREKLLSASEELHRMGREHRRRREAAGT